MQRERAFIEDLKPSDYMYYKQKTNEIEIKENYEAPFQEDKFSDKKIPTAETRRQRI